MDNQVQYCPSDNTLMTRAINAANADKFNRLCAGEWKGEYPSQSEADLALVSILCFYTDDDAQVARIFHMTTLGQRDKAHRRKYLADTIAKAREATDSSRRTIAPHIAPESPQNRRQWLPVDGDSKLPLPNGGQAHPEAWLSLVEARQSGRAVGYCQSDDDGLTIIDVDVKEGQTTTNHLQQRVMAEAQRIGAYIERSTSGRGYHVWVAGKPSQAFKRDGIEMYRDKRFMVTTFASDSDLDNLPDGTALIQAIESGTPLDFRACREITDMMNEAHNRGSRKLTDPDKFQDYLARLGQPAPFPPPINDWSPWSPALHESGLHQWHGPPGVGKSALAASACAAWSQRSDAHIAFWFAGDPDGNIEKRFRDAGGREGALSCRIVPDDLGDFDAWANALTYTTCAYLLRGWRVMLVVDPLYRLLHENIGATVSKVLRVGLRVSQHALVLVLHHDRQSQGEGPDLDEAEGTGQHGASVRAALRFKSKGKAICSKDNVSFENSRVGSHCEWDFNNGVCSNFRWLDFAQAACAEASARNEPSVSVLNAWNAAAKTHARNHGSIVKYVDLARASGLASARFQQTLKQVGLVKFKGNDNAYYVKQQIEGSTQ